MVPNVRRSTRPHRSLVRCLKARWGLRIAFSSSLHASLHPHTTMTAGAAMMSTWSRRPIAIPRTALRRSGSASQPPVGVLEAGLAGHRDRVNILGGLHLVPIKAPSQRTVDLIVGKPVRRETVRAIGNGPSTLRKNASVTCRIPALFLPLAGALCAVFSRRLRCCPIPMCSSAPRVGEQIRSPDRHLRRKSPMNHADHRQLVRLLFRKKSPGNTRNCATAPRSSAQRPLLR